jgi:hypothetical protein
VEALAAVPELRVPRLASLQRLVELPPVSLVRAADARPPRLATSLRVGLRGGHLLVRFDGRDDGWIATKTRRDDALWQEDVFEVFLAPEEPPHTYYEFEVNPLGTLFDARIESPRLVRPTICIDVLWDCPGLAARVTRREHLWSAVLRIPMAPLANGGEPPARWRANFFRVDRGGRRNPDEFSAWSPAMADPPDFHDARRFGTLILD